MPHGLTRQAKTLSDTLVRKLLRTVESETRFPQRNRVIVLLSFKAGLRAKEIACLRWNMLTDACGATITDTLSLTNDATKGHSGRVIPLHRALKKALQALQMLEREYRDIPPEEYVIQFRKKSLDPVARSNSIQFLFRHWYRMLRFQGASSHSGRRTFITKAARKMSQVGGSIRDVQALAGHASMQMTQRYVDQDPEAQRKLVELL